MPDPLLSAADFDVIRRTIRTNLTESTLPDAIIALPSYQAAGEAEVLRRDPAATTRTGADGDRVKQAAVLYTAALLARALPVYTSISENGLSYSVKLPDPESIAARLWTAADALIVAVVTGGAAAGPISMFGLLHARAR